MKTQPPSGPRKMTLAAMVAATYFMVAGGPYGLEDIVQKTGYLATLLILAITPLLWSVPTTMMVSELATAIPEEGGFYVWVRRGMGPFWGYQEIWLTLAGSVFEMALYPNLFVDYLGQFAPSVVAGHRGLAIGFVMIALCTLWNIFGAYAVGEGSVVLNILLLLPFAALVFIALLRSARPQTSGAIPLQHADLLGGVLIAMWNYMGWDNLSTVAGEVAAPQRNYTRAMFWALTLVVLSYLFPVGAVTRMGLDPNSWTTGGWVDVGRILGGSGLALAIAISALISSVGSFGALMLSFTRLPPVMADDGYLPKLFARRHPHTGAPWVAIVACAIFWAICYPLGFERNLLLDVLLTGLSIMLEFWALVGLRLREPTLARPYRVPGGVAGTILLGLPPLALMIATLVRNKDELLAGTNQLVLGLIVTLAGVLLYWLTQILRRFFQRNA